MAVFKPVVTQVEKTKTSGKDYYRVTLSPKLSFSLIIFTGSASATGAVVIYDSATSAGPAHEIYVSGAGKYGVVCKGGIDHVVKFFRT